MSIDPKLRSLLRCPVTKQQLSSIKPNEIEQLNQLIKHAKLSQLDGTVITQPIKEALITENRQIIYQIIDGIPIMLEACSIITQQISNLDKAYSE